MKRITILLTVFAACGQPQGPDVVALIGDQQLRYQEFSEYIAASVGGRAEGLQSGVLTALFDEFLDQAVALQLASGEVPAGTPADRAFEVWVDAFDVDRPTTAELRARFGRGHAAGERRAVLRQILVPAREEAERLRQQIAAGLSFVDAADGVSAAGAAGPAGGLQGSFAADDLPPAVANVVFALEPGVVSEIVALDHGYALFQVDRFTEADANAFEQARSELERAMLAERRQQELDRRVAAFRSPENVTIYPANLPFEYGGVYKDLANEIN